ncbi:AAA family ATPase [Halomonas litopenaei]|jgi:MoxR-like ATPase|uniref:MoxR family ATPase n=3 Tax=Halomonas TaxID=2745 RepID=A0AAU7KMC3_9GAMM|nr:MULTISPECIES: MoxR family ATPase [Halomonas]MBR9772050.1 MoxR family ATPase [Gammaproteobacteria bacterium]PTL92721.1 AAA family ATPase [Halomonas sp. SYSU XM8]PTL96375.1 AAA family ATPase [Halomonas litopenaei]RQW72839.1 MoxR family ATPase [Halomonas sp. YLB-10]
MSLNDDIKGLEAAIGESIIGQRDVIRRLVIGLLAGGNLLIEGLPGLAKTRAVKAMARHLEADFSRIQFTPDLLPSDVTGSEVYHQGEEGAVFRFHPGPLFANLVLADEINRAPAKVQSALLEAMEERQVTVGGTTHKMPALFMVLATQNPIEQEGTYPLPEAQMDRFMMHVRVDYPSREEEVQVIRLVRQEEQANNREASPAAGDAPAQVPVALAQEAIFAARREIAALHVAEPMEQYMATLVDATRHPADFSDDLARYIELGASPRASLALDRCARAHAWLEGRDYVDPVDVQQVAPEVLRHRIGLSFEAQGQGFSADDAVATLLGCVALP